MSGSVGTSWKFASKPPGIGFGIALPGPFANATSGSASPSPASPPSVAALRRRNCPRESSPVLIRHLSLVRFESKLVAPPGSMGPALGFHSVPHPTVDAVAVHDPAGLHGRVDGRRADEPEAGGLQPPRQLLPVRPVAVLPHELVERRPGLAQRERRPRVRDRGLDLAAMPDDPRVGEQTLDVALAEARDLLGIEAGEGAPECLALAQDRDPREAGLEA